MDFMDLMNKLSKQQRENAVLVATAAAKAGVDPTLAVAVAYQESRLNLNPARGSSGEIGMMQVMPATGKAIGFDEQALLDPQKNIEAGVEYLRRALVATGNNPKLAAAYYNGGPGALEALKSGKEPDQRVINYVRSLSSYGTFANAPQVQPNPSGSDQAAQANPAEKRPPAAETDDEIKGTLDDMRREALERSDLDAQERRQAQLYGGGAGATISAAKAAGTAGGSLLKSAARALEEGRQSARGAPVAPVAPPTVSGASPVAPPRSPASPAGAARLTSPTGAADAGRMAAGQTGTMPYNYAKAAGLTDIEAGRALDMTKQTGGVHDLTTQRREGMQRIQQLFPGEKYVENPRFGGLLTLDQGAGGGPRQSFAVQGPVRDVPPGTLMGPAAPPPEGALREIPRRVPVPTTTAPQAPSGLDQVSQKFSNMMRATGAGLAAVGRYIAPPLTVASAAGEGVNIAQQLRRPSSSGLDVLGQSMVGAPPQRDYTSMGLSGLNILGAGMSLFPTTAAVGIPLSLGTAAAQAYRDNPEAREFIRRRLQEAGQAQASDPMTGFPY